MKKSRFAAVLLLIVISLTGCAANSGEDFNNMLSTIDKINDADTDGSLSDSETETENVVIYDEPGTEAQSG
ncbi:MAG: hypothetical protein LIO94_05095 [Clostridiales bacterium]|nr:hypothetical protein [Clostridiales bacterium]